ncbi:MAG: PKD domain-containing protein [Rhodothermales bacterium]
MAHCLACFPTRFVAGLVLLLSGCTAPSTVAQPLVPPTVEVCAAEPVLAVVGEPVDFIAAVGGKVDTASWDFGDGTTAAVRDTTHTYAEPGVYGAAFTAANAAGRTACTATVVVDAPYCLDIVELNSVYFGRNSSRIDDGMADPNTEARLAENLELILSCPSMAIEIGGVAQARERRPRTLAEERAQAVGAYYIKGGARPEQIRIIEGTITTSDPDESGPIVRTRRADSFPRPAQR